MTPFALLLTRCGLSHREAADLHGVRIDTIKSWASGRRSAPDGAVDELRALYAKIERAAEEQLKLVADLEVKHGPQQIIELRIASNDAEARKGGWPCVGAQTAAYGIVVARLSGREIRIA